jgi:hypothetical protein
MKKNRIMINVEGGVVNFVYVDNPKNLEVVVFDEDNLEADGVSEVERDAKWNELIEGTVAIY